MIGAGFSACGSLIYASLLLPFRLHSDNFRKSGEIIWRVPALYIGESKICRSYSGWRVEGNAFEFVALGQIDARSVR